MTLIRLDQVHKHFTNVHALRDLSLTLNPGEVLGLFGHNGAGKTTTMKLILGLEKPSQGLVEVLGQSPWRRQFSEQRHQIGFLPESVSFYPQLTGREVLHYFARLKKIDTAQADNLLSIARSKPTPRACGNGWGWPRRCLANPGCYYWMSPPWAWTPSPPRNSMAW